MSTATRTTKITAPPDVVFEHWSDARLWANWSPLISSAQLLSPEPIGAGSRMQVVYQFMGVTMIHELVEYERPSHLVLRVTDGLPGKRTSHEISCVPLADGTLLTHIYRDQGTGARAALAPVIQLGTWLRVRKDGTCLQRYLEEKR